MKNVGQDAFTKRNTSCNVIYKLMANDGKLGEWVLSPSKYKLKQLHNANSVLVDHSSEVMQTHCITCNEEITFIRLRQIYSQRSMVSKLRAQVNVQIPELHFDDTQKSMTEGFTVTFFSLNLSSHLAQTLDSDQISIRKCFHYSKIIRFIPLPISLPDFHSAFQDGGGCDRSLPLLLLLLLLNTFPPNVYTNILHVNTTKILPCNKTRALVFTAYFQHLIQESSITSAHERGTNTWQTTFKTPTCMGVK